MLTEVGGGVVGKDGLPNCCYEVCLQLMAVSLRSVWRGGYWGVVVLKRSCEEFFFHDMTRVLT